MGLHIIVRPVGALWKEADPDPAAVARLCREIRELASERLGFEIVTDVVEPDLGGKYE